MIDPSVSQPDNTISGFAPQIPDLVVCLEDLFSLSKTSITISQHLVNDAEQSSQIIQSDFARTGDPNVCSFSLQYPVEITKPRLTSSAFDATRLMPRVLFTGERDRFVTRLREQTTAASFRPVTAGLRHLDVTRISPLKTFVEPAIQLILEGEDVRGELQLVRGLIVSCAS